MFSNTETQYESKYTEQTKDTIQKEQMVNCRICFQEMELNEVPNICKCKKQQSAIHQNCLSEWINSAVMYQQGLLSCYINCNVCMSKIYLKTEFKFNCKPLRKIEFFGDKLLITLSMIVALLIGLMMIGMSVMLLQNSLNDKLVEILAYVGLAVGFLVTVLDIVCYIYIVLVDKTIGIIGIKGLQLKEIIKNNEKPKQTEYDSNDSIAKLQIQITSDQMLQDITD